MKKASVVWQIAGFIFVSIFGVILHFLFDWTNRSIIVAPFSAINESVWEHTKLLFFPMLVFALVEGRYIGRSYKSFWCIKLLGTVFGIALIPILYYTVNGAFGQTPDWINIAVFFFAALIGYTTEAYMLNKGAVNCKYPKMSFIILILIAFLFVVLTFVPPHIPLFEDPITNTYGF